MATTLRIKDATKSAAEMTEEERFSVYSAYLSAMRLSEDLLVASSLLLYAGRDIDWHLSQAEEKFTELAARMATMRAALAKPEAA